MCKRRIWGSIFLSIRFAQKRFSIKKLGLKIFGSNFGFKKIPNPKEFLDWKRFSLIDFGPKINWVKITLSKVEEFIFLIEKFWPKKFNTEYLVKYNFYAWFVWQKTNIGCDQVTCDLFIMVLARNLYLNHTGLAIKILVFRGAGGNIWRGGLLRNLQQYKWGIKMSANL